MDLCPIAEAKECSCLDDRVRRDGIKFEFVINLQTTKALSRATITAHA